MTSDRLTSLTVERAELALAEERWQSERRRVLAQHEDERHEQALHESAATAASHEAHEKSMAMAQIAAESTIEMNRATVKAYERIAAAVERAADAIVKAAGVA